MASPRKTTRLKREVRNARLARQRRRNTLRKIRIMRREGVLDLFAVAADKE